VASARHLRIIGFCAEYRCLPWAWNLTLAVRAAVALGLGMLVRRGALRQDMGGHMAAVATADPTAPAFFLSYAQPQSGYVGGHLQEANGPVFRFFYDLSENVAQLISRPTGSDPGFMDQPAGNGNRWTTELLHAVGTCQVFVALLSMPYLRSMRCAMEWDAFSRRKVTAVPGLRSFQQSAIIPVTWAPFPEERAPTPIRAAQRFSPRSEPYIDVPEAYEHDGLFRLMSTSKDRSYEVIIWQLALHIANLHHSLAVEPRTPRPDELRDIFVGRSR
jgi:hypothetical protein